eukprot:TRINITY_DN17235_c0_g1_i1.p2 TRINITY_DN17235_c0_g1~~TRINITY_DN17235_c0_g1_i1.p2  ORF type:complete len:145 (-),score=53.04 TRINITY_DN17235_c0_g1_i1:646-1080(-)
MELLHPVCILSIFLIREALSLSCFVGLGNTSERDKQPVISCPEDRRYVCVKMYGGGMGDQIKRYCEKMEPEEYEDILDNEARVAEGEVFDKDPNCFSTKDRGREVKVCRCSTDKCNTGKHSTVSTTWVVIIMGVLVSLVTIILI